MTTYALENRTAKRAAQDDTPLRFRLYSAVYAVLAVAGLAFLALVGAAAA